jgi:hypothetical protein
MKMKHIGEVKRFLKAVLKAVISNSDLDHLPYLDIQVNTKNGLPDTSYLPQTFCLLRLNHDFYFPKRRKSDLPGAGKILQL